MLPIEYLHIHGNSDFLSIDISLLKNLSTLRIWFGKLSKPTDSIGYLEDLKELEIKEGNEKNFPKTLENFKFTEFNHKFQSSLEYLG